MPWRVDGDRNRRHRKSTPREIDAASDSFAGIQGRRRRAREICGDSGGSGSDPPTPYPSIGLMAQGAELAASPRYCCPGAASPELCAAVAGFRLDFAEIVFLLGGSEGLGR